MPQQNLHYSERYPDCVQVVGSWDQLLRAAFNPASNLIVWQRDVKGDFDGVSRKIGSACSAHRFDEARIKSLWATFSPQEKSAADVMMEDMHRKSQPHNQCRIVRDKAYYTNPELPAPFNMDSYLFHYDDYAGYEGTLQAYLIPYTRPATQILPIQVPLRRMIDTPRLRCIAETFIDRTFPLLPAEGKIKNLNDIFGSSYIPDTRDPAAKPFSLRPGDVARFATTLDAGMTRPCAHRAPPMRATPAVPRTIFRFNLTSADI